MTLVLPSLYSLLVLCLKFFISEVLQGFFSDLNIPEVDMATYVAEFRKNDIHSSEVTRKGHIHNNITTISRPLCIPLS